MAHYEPSINLYTYSQPDNGPWKVGEVLSDPANWYIVDPRTGAVKKIGPVSKGRGVNYFDRAVEEAERRNEQLKEANRGV